MPLPTRLLPRRTALLCCIAAASLGCASKLKLRRIAAAHTTPSNVAAFFSARDAHGRPLPDLRAADFQIHEDGEPVPARISRHTLVDQAVAASHFTLLLVDVSGSVSGSDRASPMAASASDFVRRLRPHHTVAIYAFDGERRLHPIAPFSVSEQRPALGLAGLAAFRTRDPSTNLHGAVMHALDELGRALEAATTPLRFGTLIVLTDHADHAARVPLQEMLDAVDASRASVFAVGVGNEVDDASLARVGKTGFIRVDDSAAMVSAVAQLGERIIDLTDSYYLLSYCSPARVGYHRVAIEARVGDQTGRLSYGFAASGFASGCDPKRAPSF